MSRFAVTRPRTMNIPHISHFPMSVIKHMLKWNISRDGITVDISRDGITVDISRVGITVDISRDGITVDISRDGISVDTYLKG